MKKRIGITIIWIVFTIAASFITKEIIGTSTLVRESTDGLYSQQVLDEDVSLILGRQHYKNEIVRRNYYRELPMKGSDMFWYILVFGGGTLMIFLSTKLPKTYSFMIIVLVLAVLTGMVLGVVFAENLSEHYRLEMPTWFNWKPFLYSLGSGGLIALLVFGIHLIKAEGK